MCKLFFFFFLNKPLTVTRFLSRKKTLWTKLCLQLCYRKAKSQSRYAFRLTSHRSVHCSALYIGDVFLQIAQAELILQLCLLHLRQCTFFTTVNQVALSCLYPFGKMCCLKTAGHWWWCCHPLLSFWSVLRPSLTPGWMSRMELWQRDPENVFHISVGLSMSDLSFVLPFGPRGCNEVLDVIYAPGTNLF